MKSPKIFRLFRYFSLFRNPLLIARSSELLARSGEWDCDSECCSFADFTLNGDLAAVVFDHAIAYGETEAGPFADLFSREKRIVNSREIFRIDSHSVVAEADDRILIVVFSGDFQSSPTGHGVARIEDQIHKYLLQLWRVSRGGRQSFRVIASDFDICIVELRFK